MKRICLIFVALLLSLILIGCVAEETQPDNFIIDPETVTQFYIRWWTSRYDLLVTAETEPELFEYLMNTFAGEYTPLKEITPSSGADSPTIWFYSKDAKLGGFMTAPNTDKVICSGYWYTNTSQAINCSDIWDILKTYETEANMLEFNGVGNYYFRAGTYGKEHVEIPDGPITTN